MPDDRPIECDVIVPAFNEAANIDPLFDAIEPVRHHIRHVIIADNASTDDTAELAMRRGAIVVHEARRGYGAACLRGHAWIAEDAPKPPDVVAYLDADLADDPAALPDLLAPIASGEADIVIGSRVRRAEPGALNAVQRFGNGLACTMMHVLGGRRYSDLGPFRAIRYERLLELDMRDPTWGWTVEMQMKAALRRIPLVEVDVPYRRRHAGKSKISGTVRGVARAGTKIIWTIGRERFRRQRVS